ncbi:MAG: hypothetical protein HY699_07760 [Deltaproteobacteria bacterium]|nr:hypothetical protein [Deltaproteobacteria bacterium]
MKVSEGKPDRLFWWLGLAVFALGARGAVAQCPFVSGSTGADGAFAPSANITRALPPDGVFNFTTVNIKPGVTVKFQRNQKNTPVYILATGNVTIDGTIDISGTDGGSNGVAGVGGSGGFDGGAGALLCGGAGLGPAGGAPGCGGFLAASAGDGGFFGSYGNPVLNPLIGGSGGGGANGATNRAFGGGGGGGAILIASSGTVNLSGSIVSYGGSAGRSGGCLFGGSGAGGAIRIIANTIAGGGGFFVGGGGHCECGCPYAAGGRVRFEACDPQFTGPNPGWSAEGPYTFAFSTSPVFLSAVPTLAITSVGGVAAPGNPTGSYTAVPDISLEAGTTTATVEIAATGISTNGEPPATVKVKVVPQSGAPSMVTSTALAGTLESSTASAEVALAAGRNLITAETTVTIGGDGGAAMVIGQIDGEPIEKVRVAATYGGGSSLTYITASGRGIPAGGTGL